jgi:hypothetical protein
MILTDLSPTDLPIDVSDDWDDQDLTDVVAHSVGHARNQPNEVDGVDDDGR